MKFVPVWSTAKTKRDRKRLYKTLIPVLREVARECGYGLGVHGSMTRDLDLIAVPWVEKCLKPETLAKRMEKAVCKYPSVFRHYYTTIRKNATKKPHGRIAFAFYTGPHTYVDLSVIPPK